MYKENQDCDVIFKVRGTTYTAHRIILRARAPYFLNAFPQNAKDRCVIDIEDCEPSTFSQFLRFLYCGEIDPISQEIIFGLFSLAIRYKVQDLRIKCLEYLKENMTVATFCDTMTLALNYAESELTDISADFFIQNATDILASNEWKAFVVKYPTESSDLFVKFAHSVQL